MKRERERVRNEAGGIVPITFVITESIPKLSIMNI